MIKLTGIADEAGASLDVQIQAHQELGWDSIESRGVEIDGVKGNLHEIPDAVFDKVVARLQERGMKISGFGSLIGNWAKKITDDFSITEAEISRAIPRMQRLGAKLIRVMSYAVCKDEGGKDLEEQFAPERIKRMIEVNKRFADAGLTATRHWPEFGLAAVRVPAAGDSRSRDEAQTAARARLIQQPGVRYVETDWAIEAASLPPPDDPRYPEQWALEKIHMPAAWEITTGDPNLIVALIDSGLGLAHEDLAGVSLWTNELEMAGLPGEDDDGNGYVDDFHGWDWVGSVNTFADPFGHGICLIQFLNRGYDEIAERA